MEKGETSSIITAFMRLKADNDRLRRMVECYTNQHNELYAAMISFLIQNGKEMRLRKENVLALHLGDYKIETMDVGEEIVYRLKWVAEPT